MSTSTANASTHYTPGYALGKLLMIAYGFILFSLGAIQLWTPLHLLMSGIRARAEAVSVIKSKDGLPDQVLTDDRQIQHQMEAHDRSYTFWNLFRFQLANGQSVTVRCPIGSLIKPLFPLTDSDGLPTSSLVFYAANDPAKIVFPQIISTWFAPGVLVLAGLLCMSIGGTLYYWSRRPIPLPHLPPPV